MLLTERCTGLRCPKIRTELCVKVEVCVSLGIRDERCKSKGGLGESCHSELFAGEKFPMTALADAAFRLAPFLWDSFDTRADLLICVAVGIYLGRKGEIVCPGISRASMDFEFGYA